MNTLTSVSEFTPEEKKANDAFFVKVFWHIAPAAVASALFLLAGTDAGKNHQLSELQRNPDPLVEKLSEEQLIILRDATLKALAAKNTESK